MIIGSGITGCSVAKELLHLDPTIKITLLEARTITSGATGRNGGHIATHPIVDYSALADYVGKDEAIKICRFRLAHYDLIYDDLKAIEEELLEISEIRRVQAVCGLLDEEKLESMKGKKERFESDWPEFKGRMRILEKKDPVFKVIHVIFQNSFDIVDQGRNSKCRALQQSRLNNQELYGHIA